MRTRPSPTMMIATHSVRLSASNSYNFDCCQPGMSDLNSDRDLGEENGHFAGHLNSNILYCHRSFWPVLPHRKYEKFTFYREDLPLSCKTIVKPLQTLCVMTRERGRVGVTENINNFYFLGIKLEFRDLASMPQLLQISDVGLMFQPRLVLQVQT